MKAILTILVLTFGLLANGQNIHWIIFVDTEDLYLGPDNKNGKSVLCTQFIDKVNEAVRQKGYKNKIYIYDGNKCNSQECLNSIEEISCSKKDIVVFYYLGHGARGDADNSENPWPEMEFVGNSSYISLEDIHNSIKKKNPQLAVTFGMCCNVVKPSHRKSVELVNQRRKLKLISKDFAKKIQDWFLSYKGDILISAASPDQLAYGGLNYGGTEVDFFTGTLCMLIDNYSSFPVIKITWDRFLKDLTYWTNYHVRTEIDEEQTPIYKINVTKIK